MWGIDNERCECSSLIVKNSVLDQVQIICGSTEFYR